MRVITGSAKGRNLRTLAGLATRPTADRVKQALFNILQNEVEGRAVLDLFAGSGQLGIEALSRGAKSCLFADSSAEACAVVRQNLQATHLADRAQVLCRDAQQVLASSRESFDIAFLDPPYADGLLPSLLPLVAQRMRETGVIVCETEAGIDLPVTAGEFTVRRCERYGRACLWFYRVPKEGLL